MSGSSENLINIPAIFYSLLWQTREMGFFKEVLKNSKVDRLKTLIFFRDYKPGVLITFDQEKGDFSIEPIKDIENCEYDCAIIGKLRPIIKSFEKHFISRNFWNLLSGKIKLKRIGKLLKFGKVLIRCAI
ncbi:MAG: hypothetical protein ACTSR8_07080 [Promethearchaeota archaeon]